MTDRPRWVGVIALAAVLVATGCHKLLGLSPPREAIDASSGQDSADAEPVDAAVPLVLHVVTGGIGSGGTITSDPAGISCPGTCDATFPPGTSVALSASTVTTAAFTGFYGAPCTGGATCTVATTGPVTVLARYFADTNVAFVTSTVQAPGAFDSLAAADALCNARGSAAGVPGPFLAYLSDGATTASGRLAAAGKGDFIPAVWFRTDGQRFADSFPELAAGDVIAPLRIDENGSDVGDDAIAVTNTDASGNAGPNNACQGYASTGSDDVLLAGSPAGGFGQWSSDAPGVTCDQPAHLYCFRGNSRNAAFDSPTVGTTIMYVSSKPLTPGSGVGGADGLCKADAQAQHLPNPTTMALVTADGMPVASRFKQFIFMDPPVRPDGEPVAVSMGALFTGQGFTGPVDEAADKSLIDAQVWIGAGDFASFQEDCVDWTSTSTSAFGAQRPASTTRAPTFFQQATCADATAHVLCVNFIAGVLPD